MEQTLRRITWILNLRRMQNSGILSKKEVKRIEWKINKKTLAGGCKGETNQERTY